LVDESSVLSAQNGTDAGPPKKIKIYGNDQMDYAGSMWVAEHPQEAQVMAM
jgi:hypothetical protein